MKSPGRNHPAGRDRSTRGRIGCGASSNDDAYCGAKVEYRTSSTPAYTDGLDLHYSTNNAPTKTWGRARLRIADNCACTNNGYPPTKAWAPPKPALRTTRAGPIIGAHPRKPGVQLRIADNCACTNRRCLPTDHVAGGLVKLTQSARFPTWANTGRKRPARQRLRKPPPRTSALRTTLGVPTMGPAHETAVQDQAPHCGQDLVHQQWGTPINRYTGSGLE